MSGYNARVQQLYRDASQFPQGGVLVGAGRPPKGKRHCVWYEDAPHGRMTKSGRPVQRCHKFASGPKGSGRTGGRLQSPAQKAYHREVSRVARANGVSAAVAASMIKRG